MLEIGVIGAVTMAIVEMGKRKFPNTFTGDVNALLTALVFTLLNIANAAYFGGDVKLAMSDGIVQGLATAGLYRAVSGLSKRNSVDLSEQVNVQAIAHEMSGGSDENGTVVRGFGGGK